MDTKQAIIKSAQKLFADQGFKTTTVREIAKDAGANIAMVYYYFETKEGLHQKIIEDSFSALALLLRDCVDDSKGPKENLYSIIKTFITFFHEHRTLHRIMLREVAGRSKHIELIVKKYISKNFTLINSTIQQGVQEGIFREQDTVLSTFSLIGMILHYFNAEPIIKQLVGTGSEDIIKHLPDHIFNIFMQGITQAGNARK